MNDKYILDIVEKGLRGNVLDDLVEGWKFTIDEVSSNVYKVDGADKYGHHVSAHDIDPKKAIARSISNAQKIDQRRKYFEKIKSKIAKIFTAT